MKLTKKVLKAKYKPDCYILVSFQKRDLKETYGEIRVRPAISFLFDAGYFAAEWEPEHGPIQVWEKCDEGAENSREHYYYDFVFDTPLNWSQMAVDDYHLPEAAHDGDFDYIFSVLEWWADR